MAKNFRKRKFTTRIKPITQTQIEKLRATRLKNAKNYKETKFFKSAQFDKQIRSNIRTNRARYNSTQLDKIVKSLNSTKDEEKEVRNLFGEKYQYRNGKRIKRNSFTSLSQTKRLKKISASIKKKKFNVKNYLRKSDKYAEVKDYLPDNPETNEIIQALTRGAFYFENKTLIQRHNKNVQKYGSIDASTRKAGIDLSNKYYESLNDENQDVIDFFESDK